MARFQTVNPVNNKVLKRFSAHSVPAVENLLEKARFGSDINRTSALHIRSRRLLAVSEILLNNKTKYAELMALEMGKPLAQGIAEIEKCAWVCKYYAENAKHYIKEESINTEFSQSLITYAPLGVLLAIMPWNYPFWQVFRFAAPALMAGNAILLKHSPNVPQCALAIEEIFDKAQFHEGVFQNVFLPPRRVANLIADKRIAAISLTGSTEAGSKVAENAGRNIKKCVLELGGSDPFIVLDDANVKMAAKVAVQARMQNAGQSCIAAKRFILTEKVHDVFVELFLEELSSQVMGDPMDENTTIGPLAREDLAVQLQRQVNKSVRAGAEILMGGQRPSKSKGAFYPPTVLDKVKPGMPAFDQELFGPVAAIITVKNEQEAIATANQTPYGLAASIWTVNVERAQRLARQLDCGAVFINSMVKSDPRLPFGGIKKSGYGRELSSAGIREFVNIKTLVVA